MRKAQTEILGLVIIVLLISIGILIAFLIFSKPVGKDIIYEQESLLAANFLSTLVKSDSSCKGRSVGELIQNCVESGSGVSLDCGDGSSACSRANFLIDVFLKKFFTEEGKKFYFSINNAQGNSPQDVDAFVFGTVCKGEFESKTRPLVFLGGTIYLKLDICS